MAVQTRAYCPRCFESFKGDTRCPKHNVRLVMLKSSPDNLEGTIVDGKYEVVETIGKGGMGTVYRARQFPIGREVALKVLRRDYLEDHKGVTRFVREAQAASILKSRYSAMLHDFGLAPEGFLYYTMELATGRLLSDIIDRDGPISIERTLHLTSHICHSLAEAHSHAIIHRDIKADNIIVTHDQDGHEIGKVLDFGTAKLLDLTERDAKVTDPGIVCGTPEYMSPEQAQALPVDARSDIYSLGILMYEMLTGLLPFRAKNSIAVLLMHVNDHPRPMSEANPNVRIPPGLQKLVRQMMAKDPAHRVQSTVDVLREVQDLLEDVVESSGRPTAYKVAEHESFRQERRGEESVARPRMDTIVEALEEPIVPDEMRRGRGLEAEERSMTMELSAGSLWTEGTPPEPEATVVDTTDEREARIPTSKELPAVAAWRGAVSAPDPGRRSFFLILGGFLAVVTIVSALFFASNGYRTEPLPGSAVEAGDRTPQAGGQRPETGGKARGEAVKGATGEAERMATEAARLLAQEERRKAEEARKRAQAQMATIEEERRQATEEKRKATEEKRLAEAERQQAEAERRKAEEERRKAEEERKRAEAEKALAAAEAAVAAEAQAEAAAKAEAEAKAKAEAEAKAKAEAEAKAKAKAKTQAEEDEKRAEEEKREAAKKRKERRERDRKETKTEVTARPEEKQETPPRTDGKVDFTIDDLQ